MSAVIKAVNRAYDREETRPFWKTRMIAIVLVLLTGLVHAGLLLLIVFGGPLGDAIADKAGLGGAFELALGDPALADRLRRDPPLLRARLLPGAERRLRSWRWLTPGSVVGALAVARALGALRALHELLGSYRDVRRARRRDRAAAVAELLRVRAALRRGAERGARAAGEIRAAGGENAGLVKPSRRPR